MSASSFKLVFCTWNHKWTLIPGILTYADLDPRPLGVLAWIALEIMLQKAIDNYHKTLNPVKTADIIETALVQLCTQVSVIFKNPTHPCGGSHVTDSQFLNPAARNYFKSTFPAPAAFLNNIIPSKDNLFKFKRKHVDACFILKKSLCFDRNMSISCTFSQMVSDN